MYNILGQVRVVRVPNQTDSNDLWTVEENSGHPELLPALTLRRKRDKFSTRISKNTKSHYDEDKYKSYRTAAKVTHARVL